MPGSLWIKGDLAAIMDEANVGLWQVDKKTGTLTVSGRRCIRDLFGANEDRWQANIYDFLSVYCHPDDAQGVNSVRDILGGLFPVAKAEFRVWNEKLRTWVWVSTLCHAKLNDKGKLQSAYGMFENITLAKSHEEAQKQAELAIQRAHSMFDSMPLCCNLWDDNLNNVDCNSETVRLFNLNTKKDYLDNFESLSPEFQPNGMRSSALAQACVKEAFQTGYKRFDWVHQRFDGELLPVEVSLHRVLWGNSHYVIGFMRDLREKSAMRAEMNAAYEALCIARDMALRNTEAKNDFLLSMSHEIRSPMNVILDMSQLLEVTDLTEVQRQYVGQTSNAARRLLRAINNILDFATIEAGNFEMDIVPFSLKDLFDEFAVYFRGILREKDLFLQFEFIDLLPDNVMGDPLRVKQIFLSLISNGIKFTTEGGVTICIEGVTTQGEELQIKFSVRDSGTGMTDEQVQRLFTVSSQAKTSRDRNIGVTGLGFALSRQLIKLMGGTIWCESVAGKGTVFYFTLSFLQAAQPDAEKPPFSKEDGLLVCAEAQKKILLAEDNVINRTIAAEILRDAGYEVITASNGQEAVELLLESGGGVSLVLMDMQMPVMDGFEASQKIRQCHQFSSIPIIAMSAHATADGKELCSAHGMDDHIGKPVATDELYAMLLKWLP